MDPLVSIVIPSYNQGAFLEQAVLSVLEQTYAHIELLVIDGASSDESISILKRYSDRITYWVSEPDRGQTDAINKGFHRAQGEYLWWLNSDDELLLDSITSTVQYLKSNPDVDLVYGDLIWMDEAGSFLQNYHYAPFDFPANIKNWVDISQAGALARHEALRSIGYLDESLHYLMDRDLWIRLALNGSQIRYLPQPLARFRVYAQSKTQAGSPQAAVERYETTRTALQHPYFEGHPAAQRSAWARTHAASARVYMKCGEYGLSLREVLRTFRSSPAAFFSSDVLTALFWSLPGLLLGRNRITRLRQVIRAARFHRGKDTDLEDAEGVQ
ncbi:MAG: glycosyltransferase [Anaerolineales bacterium]|nr:glycosyltransferase [Anaerolineales bacterium]